jgi:SagB-type dehydrogenase family enzyme
MVAIITSRIRLISAEYSKIAYRLSLLNCGVILGALDRRCHELGLAGCCLGGSDSSFFQKLTGCNLAEETSMAEFAFGRARN